MLYNEYTHYYVIVHVVHIGHYLVITYLDLTKSPTYFHK